MPIKETLHLTEIVSRRNLVILLALITMSLISISNVEADDDIDSIWRSFNERSQIELILDDNEMESTDIFNDVQQQGTPEALDTGGLTVNIINGVNVRNITTDGSGFGNVDRNFPRGETEVVGWFNADSTPLGAIAGGTWLILEGGKHAVSTVVGRIETDYSVITDEEAATTQEFKFNGSIFVPVEPEPIATQAPSAPAEVAPAAPTETPDNEIPATPEPAGTPEALTMYEYPESVTLTYPVPGQMHTGETITETIEVNAERGFAAPFGRISEGFSAVTDSIAQFELTGNGENEEDWARIPYHGTVVSVDNDERYPDDRKYLTVETVTPEGNPIVVILNMMPYIHHYQTDSELNLITSQEDADAISHISNVVDTDVMYGDITPGTPIIFDIIDVPQGAGGNTVFSGPWRSNQNQGGYPNGQPTKVFNAVDVNTPNKIPWVNAWGGNYVITSNGN